MMSRRQVLRLSARAEAGMVATAALGTAAESCTSVLPGAAAGVALLPSRIPLPAPFTVPLPIPPQAVPSGSGADDDVYDLTARPATVELLPGVRTPVWGYDGRFPGPTIRARRDRAVLVRLRTERPVPTVLHPHGGTTPPNPMASPPPSSYRPGGRARPDTVPRPR
jgi:spore coat protein A